MGEGVGGGKRVSQGSGWGVGGGKKGESWVIEKGRKEEEQERRNDRYEVGGGKRMHLMSTTFYSRQMKQWVVTNISPSQSSLPPLIFRIPGSLSSGHLRRLTRDMARSCVNICD